MLKNLNTDLKREIDEFWKLIEENDSIVIFGHIWPDGDCYGSSNGLKYALKQIYPNKNIYVSKTDCVSAPYSFPASDYVSDETIASSLHIVCDLPDKKRAGDERAFSIKGKGMIKIDHHYFVEDFGGVEIIDTERGSACDLIASIIYGKIEHLNPVAASCLFLGITTDTGREQFAYYPELFRVLKKLVEDGADVKVIYDSLYSVRESRLPFQGYLFSNYKKTRFGVTYLFIDRKTCKKFNLTGHSAALAVNTIGAINASTCWVIFGEDEDGKVFAEFRSRGDKVNVQQIAKSQGGGGHFNASGCTLVSKDKIPEVLEMCEKEVLKSYGEFAPELEAMVDVCYKAMSKIMNFYKKGFNIEIKADNSPVTDADKASNKIIRDTLNKKFPGYGMLTEEDADDLSRLDKKRIFVIDPLDGTSDYVVKDDMFSINIALVEDHHPVVSVIGIPVKNDVYFAVKGQGAYYLENNKTIRRIHVSTRVSALQALDSATHPSKIAEEIFARNKDKIKEVKHCGSSWKACLVASGVADVCFNFGEGTKEWDTCAPQLIVEEAGGIYSDCEGNPLTYNKKDVYNHNGYACVNRRENIFKK